MSGIDQKESAWFKDRTAATQEGGQTPRGQTNSNSDTPAPDGTQAQVEALQAILDAAKQDVDWHKWSVAQAEAQIEALRSRLHEIAEVYAGMEGFEPVYASEAYLLRLLKQMYDLAKEEG